MYRPIGVNNEDSLGHINKIHCFSSFCLQKIGEGGGYLLFIFRGQRSDATFYRCETERKTATIQVKKSENEQKTVTILLDVRMQLHFHYSQ